MNWIGIITTLLTVINILVCLLLIFIVLLQRPKTEGLGAAFGGETASNIFGAQTTNVLANLTRWLGGLFIALCFAIAILGTVNPDRASATKDFIRQKELEKAEKQKQKEAAEAADAARLKAEGKNPDGTLIEKPAAVTPAVAVPDPNKPAADPKAPATPPTPPDAGKNPASAPEAGKVPPADPTKPPVPAPVPATPPTDIKPAPPTSVPPTPPPSTPPTTNPAPKPQP